MPLIRFTKLTDKILDATKRQTIRLPRKNPIQAGELAHIWILRKIGVAPVLQVEPKEFQELTEHDAILDGFNTLAECQACLKDMHSELMPTSKVDLISWQPSWKPVKIMSISQIKKARNLLKQTIRQEFVSPMAREYLDEALELLIGEVGEL